VADKGDHAWDTGVFLEAGSLRSDPLRIQGTTPLNELNLPYLAEGCAAGTINITRAAKKAYAQTVSLSFGGNANAATDLSPIPATVTIPANDSVVSFSLSALPDLIPEGIETFKLYIGNNCGGFYFDSIIIEVRDIDRLQMLTNDTLNICRNSSVQLSVDPAYAAYNWTNGATLSSNGINNPLATPGGIQTKYICTATLGACTARDSVLVNWKQIAATDKTNVPCADKAVGAIKVEGTWWDQPVEYAINSNPFQAGNIIGNLNSGAYWVKMQDATCLDSINVDILQLYPDITATINTIAASCSVTPDGQIQVAASGGNGTYSYSSDGLQYQAGNTLIVPEGSYTVYVKDGNECIADVTPVIVPKINDVMVDAGADAFICEGSTYTMQAVTNAPGITWTPAASLTDITNIHAVTNTTTSRRYYLTAVNGTCTRIDSVDINVWPAPTPNAGPDAVICYGITAQLTGSGGLSWQWSADPSFITATDIEDPVVKPAVTTTYYLHVRDVHDCQSLQPDDVKITVTPSVKIFAGRDTVVALNQPLQLNAVETNNSGVSRWEWSPMTYLDNPFIASPLANIPVPFSTAPYEYTYTITGTTPAGCQGSDQIKIKVYQGPDIYVPSGFTPNNDGKNDYLAAFPVGIKEFRFLRVFDRWGQLIFQSQAAEKGWNGKIGGVEQQTGMYIWMAEGIDYNGQLIMRKGTSMLIR
jgi:gliding motility-associated-like protein